MGRYPTNVLAAGKPRQDEKVQVERVKNESPKPLAAMEWLVRLVTIPGGLVLDPFADSGATLEAAANTGRRAIGIELDHRYLPLIGKRLRRPGAGIP